MMNSMRFRVVGSVVVLLGTAAGFTRSALSQEYSYDLEYRSQKSPNSGSGRANNQHHNDSSGPRAADWLNLGGRLIEQGIRDSQKQQQQQQNNQWQNQHQHEQRPQYYQNQQQYRPSANYAPVQPKPVAPKNVIAKKKSKANPLNFQPISLRSTAETDARQQVEAEKSKAMIDASLIAQIQGSGNPQLINDWNAVVQGGHKTADVDKFLAQHGPGGDNSLKASFLEDAELRQKFAKYADALDSGSLTEVGKQQSLSELQSSVAAIAAKPGSNPTYYGTLADNVTEMNNFHTMGQLANATQGSANPFPILVQGATQMGMPVMFVSEMTGFPVMSVDRVSDAGTTLTASILIISPESNGQTVSYLLDAHQFEMAAGTQQRLDRSYMITFDSGNGARRNGTSSPTASTNGVTTTRPAGISTRSR